MSHPYEPSALERAAPALLEATEMLLKLVGDMMPGVRFIALPDYALLNDAQVKGEAAIAAARVCPNCEGGGCRSCLSD